VSTLGTVRFLSNPASLSTRSSPSFSGRATYFSEATGRSRTIDLSKGGCFCIKNDSCSSWPIIFAGVCPTRCLSERVRCAWSKNPASCAASRMETPCFRRFVAYRGAPRFWRKRTVGHARGLQKKMPLHRPPGQGRILAPARHLPRHDHVRSRRASRGALQMLPHSRNPDTPKRSHSTRTIDQSLLASFTSCRSSRFATGSCGMKVPQPEANSEPLAFRRTIDHRCLSSPDPRTVRVVLPLWRVTTISQ